MCRVFPCSLILVMALVSFVTIFIIFSNVSSCYLRSHSGDGVRKMSSHITIYITSALQADTLFARESPPLPHESTLVAQSLVFSRHCEPSESWLSFGGVSRLLCGMGFASGSITVVIPVLSITV